MRKLGGPETALAALEAIVGPAGIRIGPDMDSFTNDWRGRSSGSAIAVLLPASTEEVSRIMAYCAAQGLTVQPQGGNTGLCAGSVPPAEATGVLLSTARLNAIREIDTVGDVAVVEAGVTLTTLHEAAKAQGREFPLSLGSQGSAQIGGLISTNAGGVEALRHGPMRDLVMGIEAVLPDGSVIRRLGGLRKDNRGYDWKHLFIGGEGTLGIVTAAALKLVPAARDEAHAWCAVASPAAAVDLYRRLRNRFSMAVHTCELLSASEVDIALTHVPGLRIPFARTPAWSVILTLGDTDPDARMGVRLEAFLGEMADAGVIEDAALPKNLAEAEEFWRLRHSLSEANKRAGMGLVFDVSVRVSHVPAFMARSEAASRRIAPMATPLFVVHLGDGNVHLISMLAFKDVPPPAELEALMDRLFGEIHDIAEAMNGSFSAEHGIGRKLVKEMELRQPPAEIELMRRIKRAVDPDNRMAPGVLLDPAHLGDGGGASR